MRLLRGDWVREAHVVCVLIASTLVPLPVQADPPIPPPLEGLPDRLVFAGSAEYPPFQWLDSSNEPRGFVIDLQTAIAHQGGLEVEHRLMEWDQALEAVENDEADVVAAFVSDDRQERFDFTSPFYFVVHAIYAPSPETTRNDPDGLADTRVAVVEDSYAHDRLMKNQRAENLILREDIRSALLAVTEGRAEIALVAAHTARHAIAEGSIDIYQVSPPFWPRAYSFAVRQGREDLHTWLEEQLGLLHANGTYFEIHSDWLSELEWQPQSWQDHLRQLIWLVGPLLLLGAAGYLWSWSLRRRVAQKTHLLSQELESRRALQGELQYRLEHDAVTGLPNRDAFIRRLDGLIESEPNQPATVALVQLVNLEQLITTFSHKVALELQKAFARLLEAQGFREIGHFEPGLFAIAAEKPLGGSELVGCLTETLDLGAVEVDPLVVVGVVNGLDAEGHDRAADSLVRRGVLAVSSAREQHRRWMTYSTDLEPDADDLLLLQDFHRNGTRDMFLEYQPKLEIRTGQVRAAEALVRWQHPTLGLVPPGRFIEMLEHAGLTHQITRWVIAEVADMLRRTGLGASGFRLSINIAPRDLMEPDLVDFITTTVAPPMPPHCLWLEITETGFIHDPTHTCNVLSDLRQNGCCFSVDDFGTGYSSLSYMSEFPVDEVKIDKSFVGDMLHNDRHSLIVRSTITLAHELGMTVVAEGVEDKETLQALVAMNCDAVQGYFLSRPLGEEALLAFPNPEIGDILSEAPRDES